MWYNQIRYKKGKKMFENYEKIAENYNDIHKKSLMGLSEMDFKYFVKYKIDIVKEKIS